MCTHAHTHTHREKEILCTHTQIHTTIGVDQILFQESNLEVVQHWKKSINQPINPHSPLSTKVPNKGTQQFYSNTHLQWQTKRIQLHDHRQAVFSSPNPLRGSASDWISSNQRSGGQHCRTLERHLTEVRVWVMVTVDGYSTTDWQIPALMTKTRNW